MNCIVCGNAAQQTEEAWVCLRCRTVRTIYDYDPALYGQWYSEHYLQSVDNTITQQLYLHRLGLVARWLKKGDSLLDVGCCNGEWLRYVGHFYERAVGFEPNYWAKARAQRDLGSRRVVGSLEDLSSKACVIPPPYDMVTMFDVIEHLPNPQEAVSHLKKHLLKPGGFLVVVTPCLDAVNLPGEGEAVGGLPTLFSWKHWKPKEHLVLYSVKGLLTLMEKCSLRLVATDLGESFIRPNNPNRDILTAIFQS